MRPSMSTLRVSKFGSRLHLLSDSTHPLQRLCYTYTESANTRILPLPNPVTPALPSIPKRLSQNTHRNATRRTSRPYRWARQRARDTVSDKAGWKGDQGIRTRQQRGVCRFPIPVFLAYFLLAAAASSTLQAGKQATRVARHLVMIILGGWLRNLECLHIHSHVCMHGAACQTQTFHAMSCHAMLCLPLVPTHTHRRPFACACAYEIDCLDLHVATGPWTLLATPCHA